MRSSIFEYKLPKKLIAQQPIQPRDASRLLVFERQSKKICHNHFYNIAKYLGEGDVVVFNDSRVIPARLIGKRDGVGRKIEILLIREIGPSIWLCLLGGKRRGLVEKVTFPGSGLEARIKKRNKDGTWQVIFNLENNKFWQEVNKIGQMPTPPYIKRQMDHSKAKRGYYQTIFAKEKGSVAAPTAGFHFTQKLVNKLKNRGVEFASITLHVGPGTFLPIREKSVEKHHLQAEWFKLDKKTAELLNKAKLGGRRIIAIGTTTARVLENCAVTPPSPTKFYKKDALRSSANERSEGRVNPRLPNYYLKPQSGETKIFIYPGHHFRFIDGLITNLHLPHSTPLLLVSALIEDQPGTKKGEGIKILLNLYKQAIKKKYRFYSFGDAMLVL